MPQNRLLPAEYSAVSPAAAPPACRTSARPAAGGRTPPGAPARTGRPRSPAGTSPRTPDRCRTPWAACPRWSRRRTAVRPAEIPPSRTPRAPGPARAPAPPGLPWGCRWSARSAVRAAPSGSGSAGGPGKSAARSMSPASTSVRMYVELTVMPSRCTGGMMSHPMPISAHFCRKSCTFPAFLWPNRWSWPGHEVHRAVCPDQHFHDRVLPRHGHHGSRSKGAKMTCSNAVQTRRISPGPVLRLELIRYTGLPRDHLLRRPVKGECRGNGSQLPGALRRLPQQCAVAPVHAVEEAQGDDSTVPSSFTLRKSFCSDVRTRRFPDGSGTENRPIRARRPGTAPPASGSDTADGIAVAGTGPWSRGAGDAHRPGDCRNRESARAAAGPRPPPARRSMRHGARPG